MAQELFCKESQHRSLIKRTVLGFETPETHKFHRFLRQRALESLLYFETLTTKKTKSSLPLQDGSVLIPEINIAADANSLQTFQFIDRSDISSPGIIYLGHSKNTFGTDVYTWLYKVGTTTFILYFTRYVFDDFQFLMLFSKRHAVRKLPTSSSLGGGGRGDDDQHRFPIPLLLDLLPFSSGGDSINKFHAYLKDQVKRLRLPIPCSLMIMSRAGFPIIQSLEELTDLIKTITTNFIMLIPPLQSLPFQQPGWYLICTGLVDEQTIQRYKKAGLRWIKTASSTHYIINIYPLDRAELFGPKKKDEYTVFSENSFQYTSQGKNKQELLWKIFGAVDTMEELRGYIEYLDSTISPSYGRVIIPVNIQYIDYEKIKKLHDQLDADAKYQAFNWYTKPGWYSFDREHPFSDPEWKCSLHPRQYSQEFDGISQFQPWNPDSAIAKVVGFQRRILTEKPIGTHGGVLQHFEEHHRHPGTFRRFSQYHDRLNALGKPNTAESKLIELSSTEITDKIKTLYQQSKIKREIQQLRKQSSTAQNNNKIQKLQDKLLSLYPNLRMTAHGEDVPERVGGGAIQTKSSSRSSLLNGSGGSRKKPPKLEQFFSRNPGSMIEQLQTHLSSRDPKRRNAFMTHPSCQSHHDEVAIDDDSQIKKTANGAKSANADGQIKKTAKKKTANSAGDGQIKKTANGGGGGDIQLIALTDKKTSM